MTEKWKQLLAEDTSRGEYYRTVVTYLQNRRGKCAYLDYISKVIPDKDYDWLRSLLSEMRESGMVWYCTGWGWRLRKGVRWPIPREETK